MVGPESGSGGRCCGIGCPDGQGPTDPLQIGRHDPPAYPAAQTGFAVVGAAIQPVTALQYADPALDPGAEAKAAPEPALLRHPDPLRAARPSAWRKHHAFDPDLPGMSL